MLTKPDLIGPGNEDEAAAVLKNVRKPLKLGYVMVKCRSQRDIDQGEIVGRSVGQSVGLFVCSCLSSCLPVLTVASPREVLLLSHRTLPFLYPV